MKAKKVTGKLLSLLVAVLMVLTLMPSVALAAESTELDFKWDKMKIEENSDTIPVEAGGEAGTIAVVANGDNNKVTINNSDSSVAEIGEGKWKSGMQAWAYDVIGKKEGETTVTVAAEDNPSVSRTFTVVVTAPAISIDFKEGKKGVKTAVGAEKGGLLVVKAVSNTDEPIADDSVTCESQDESVATVSGGSKVTKESSPYYDYYKFSIDGVAKGETKIRISSNQNSTIVKFVDVTVVDDLLTVKVGDTTTSFKVDDPLWDQAETIPVWAGRNHSFTYEESSEPAVGPELETILAASGVEVSSLDDDQLIYFLPSDGNKYEAYFTVKELLRDKRYYFPNSEDLTEGAMATEAQLADAVEIPTIICSMDNSSGRLVFGQVAPNERTKSVSLKNMSTGGTIEVLDEKAQSFACDVKADKASGSTIEPGTEIKLSSASILTTDIYYTTDGSNPSRNTALYNYRTKEMSDEPDGGLKNAIIKAPSTEGAFTLKVMQAAYGKLDSNVVTFNYTVKKAETTPAVQKGATYTVSGQSVKVTKAATATSNGAVTFTKAKNAKSVVIPKTVKLADGKVYNVTTVGAKAFTGKKIRKVTVGANVSKLAKYALKGSKATKLVVKTKKLKKSSVKGSLKGSKVKTVQVKVGKKKVNKKYIKKYKKIFTKKNAGKRVAVK